MTAAADRLRLTILGCGASYGVPRIGNDWGACDPNEPKNRRRRCSLLVERFSEGGVTRILVDTGADCREQLTDARVDWVDGVLYTHPHADHTHGIDDLRWLALRNRRRIDVYMDQSTSDRIRTAFGYCFETPEGSSYPPIMIEHRITAGNRFEINGAGGPIPVLPVLQDHGPAISLGFRFGETVYSCDISGLPEHSEPFVKDADVWIIDALRYEPHVSHYGVYQALSKAEEMNVGKVILTHLHVDLDYNELTEKLPENAMAAYDGLVIETRLDDTSVEQDHSASV